MSQKLKLETITNSSPAAGVSLDKIIAEKRIIKTRLKLLHIAAFERDLFKLHAKKLSLSSIEIPDFHLTKSHELVVPVESKIIEYNDEEKITLESYLIYLSYLYNVDFMLLYQKNPTIFYKTIMSLSIDENIKQSLFALLRGKASISFYNHLDAISTSEFREALELDKRKLARELK